MRCLKTVNAPSTPNSNLALDFHSVALSYSLCQHSALQSITPSRMQSVNIDLQAMIGKEKSTDSCSHSEVNKDSFLLVCSPIMVCQGTDFLHGAGEKFLQKVSLLSWENVLFLNMILPFSLLNPDSSLVLMMLTFRSSYHSQLAILFYFRNAISLFTTSSLQSPYQNFAT